MPGDRLIQVTAKSGWTEHKIQYFKMIQLIYIVYVYIIVIMYMTAETNAQQKIM